MVARARWFPPAFPSMMLPLPPLARPQAVVSFDFDGTLHDPASDPPVPRALFDLLKR